MQYYTPTTWINGTTKLNATNMNHIESYLKYLSDLLQNGELPTNLKNGNGSDSLQQKNAKAYSWGSIAFNSSQALGPRSFTTGGGTKATANLSFAEGEFSLAEAWASHAMGHNTITAASFQLVCGKNNVGRNNTLFEVGNGASNYIEVTPKPTYEEVLAGRYYASNSQGGHNLITELNMTEEAYAELEHVYEDNGHRTNAFEVYADGHVEIGSMGNTNLSVTTKAYVDYHNSQKQDNIPTIAITQSMITGYGTGGAPYGNPWYRFNFGSNNSILTNDKYDTIKLDITAIKVLLGIPTDFLFIKRNVTNSDQGITLYQFYIADSGFDYSHLTDQSNPYIQIAQIGDAALIYEPTSGAGFLTNRNINPTEIVSKIGELENSRVRFDTNTQGLTDVQKLNARTNIGASCVYTHHFDIVLKHADLSLIPEGMEVHINVNVISNSGTPWTKLSELDGGGYIISAFGTISYPQVITSYVFELKIFYSALNTLLLNINDLNYNNVQAVAVTTVFGGTSPNDYNIQDSVSKI